MINVIRSAIIHYFFCYQIYIEFDTFICIRYNCNNINRFPIIFSLIRLDIFGLILKM